MYRMLNKLVLRKAIIGSRIKFEIMSRIPDSFSRIHEKASMLSPFPFHTQSLTLDPKVVSC